jgi:hypothetical protein
MAPIQEGQALTGIPIGQIVTVSTPNPFGTFDYWTMAAGSTCSLQIITPTTGSTWSFACTNPNSILNIEAVYSDPQPTTCAANAICANAYSQLGVSYVNGGETPYVGFDCSGLVQAAYEAAGITLPRTAQAQYDATTKLAPDDPLEPGDLVFFGGEPSNVEHVGIYVGMEGGQAVMVDAPYTGADVRVESFPTTVGASLGTDTYLGDTTVA